MAIFVMAIILLLLSASLFLSGVDTKISGNLKLATQALQVADAGLQHALAAIPVDLDFDSQLSCGTPPCTLVSNTTSPPNSGFSYTISVENDSPDINNGGTPTDDTNNLVILTSTANGPNNTKRVVQAYVKRSLVSFTTPGALYLPASSANVGFSKDKGMFITGDDTSYTDSNSDGWADSIGDGPDPSVTGVAPILDAVRDNFKTALGTSRYNLVQGAGYSADPDIPSVVTTSDLWDVNQIALNFYNNVAPENLHVNGLKGGDCTSKSPCVFGTDVSPQITYIREGTDFINPNGHVTGSGVLVTEGKTHFRGDFEFHGLVISVKLGLTGGTVRGPSVRIISL